MNEQRWYLLELYGDDGDGGFPHANFIDYGSWTSCQRSMQRLSTPSNGNEYHIMSEDEVKNGPYWPEVSSSQYNQV